MPSRTPSFIVVGLVIIMFLLGFFYMSCSSTTTELRQALEEFEERVRSLTIKNSENEKKIELFNTNKRELEEEKLNNQRQIEEKDSEINDLNTKLNEKIAEFQSLKSDKKVLEEQLKEFKNMSDTFISKTFAVEKIQQECDEQKKSNDKQLNDLKQQIENYKQQLNQSQNNQEKSPFISNQRFQSLEIIRNSSSLFQQPLSNLSNNIGNNSIPIQTNNAQQPDQNQLARDAAGQGQNNLDVHQRLQRSLNDSLVETDINNKREFYLENAQKTVYLTSILPLNETNLPDNPSRLSADIQNNREQLQLNKNDDKQNNQGGVDVNKGVENIPKNNIS